MCCIATSTCIGAAINICAAVARADERRRASRLRACGRSFLMRVVRREPRDGCAAVVAGGRHARTGSQMPFLERLRRVRRRHRAGGGGVFRDAVHHRHALPRPANGGMMRLLRRARPPRQRGRGYVATIGGFDGIHRGHQVLIARARRRRAALRPSQHAADASSPCHASSSPATSPPRAAHDFPRALATAAKAGSGRASACCASASVCATCAADEFAGTLSRAAASGGCIIGHDFRAAQEAGHRASGSCERGSAARVRGGDASSRP